ncbi:SRPBCC family protein [Melittangium boletus]|uniref:SRPBCC family protein n=1 Tax=Melittangium boletus TaxID=83453 RepID=UPI003DA26764
MTDTSLDPSSLPLRTAEPGASVRQFTETFTTSLAPEALWAEFTRALKDSRDAVLWAHDISQVRVLQAPVGQDSVLVETVQATGTALHYRLVRFEPPRLVQYAALQGHSLAGGATITVASEEGRTVLRWQGEYRASEAALAVLDRFRAAFFSRFADALRRLDAAS